MRRQPVGGGREVSVTRVIKLRVPAVEYRAEPLRIFLGHEMPLLPVISLAFWVMPLAVRRVKRPACK